MEEKDLVKEIWEHRNDPGEWGEEAVDIEVRPNPSHVVCFRLRSDEMDMLEAGIERERTTLSAYIRKVLRLEEQRWKRERVVRFGELLRHRSTEASEGESGRSA